MSCKIGIPFIIWFIHLMTNSGISSESSPIGLKCQSSEQCIQFDTNSMCFATDNNLNEWHCLCKDDYYYDQNWTQKCVTKISFGNKCNESQQCLAQNSVCDHNNRCICRHNHYFDNILNECKHNESLKCSEDQEWNQFINKCQIRVHYSHKGGGRGGGGRGGGGRSGSSRGGGRGSGRVGGGSSIRSGGRSWWTTSWFRSRGTGSGGGYYAQNSDDEDYGFAWDKLLIVFIAVIIIMTACCYCSFKFKQQDKEAEEYWRNRSKRTVPRIVIRGADGINIPQRVANSGYKPIHRSSEVGIPSTGHRSRSSSTSSRRELYRPDDSDQPSSPPPPYTPLPTMTDTPILPFSSLPTVPHSPRPHSPSKPRSEAKAFNDSTSIPMSAPNQSTSGETLVRHPSNPNMILPFASSQP